MVMGVRECDITVTPTVFGPNTAVSTLPSFPRDFAQLTLCPPGVGGGREGRGGGDQTHNHTELQARETSVFLSPALRDLSSAASGC